MSPSIKFLAFLVVTAVVLAGVWYFLMMRSTEAPLAGIDTTNSRGDAPVVVTKTDIASTGSGLPAGFPRDIPVETGNITESYRVAYNERGVTQYTVSYTSLKTRDALWDSYSSYMKSAGYTVDQSATSRSLGQIMGEKAGDTLSVIVSTRSGVALVQINLLDR